MVLRLVANVRDLLTGMPPKRMAFERTALSESQAARISLYSTWPSVPG